MKKLVLLLLFVASSAILFVTQTGLQYSTFDLASGCYVPRGRDSTALSDAITEITWNACIRISPSYGGRASGDMSILADLTVPSRISLNIPHGPRFSVGGGVTLTLDCRTIQAGGYQIFTGTGDVVCSDGGYVNGLWAGLVGDDATDNATAFARLGAMKAQRVYIPYGTYRGNNATALLSFVDQQGVTVYGDGAGITNIKQMGTGDAIDIDYSAAWFAAGNRPNNMVIRDLTLLGNDTAAKGIDTNACSLCVIQDTSIAFFTNHSVDLRGNWVQVSLVNNRITGSSVAAGAGRMVNAVAGNMLRLERNYFNGIGNGSGYAVTVYSNADVEAVGNTYDGVATAIETAGPWTSVQERFDTTSPPPGALTTAYHKTNNSSLVTVNPYGIDESHITFDGSDRRFISWIGGSGVAERGVFGGTTFMSTLTPAALTGNVDNYAPTNCNYTSFWRIDPGGADRTITGINCDNHTGKILLINNNGAPGEEITLSDLDAGSAAANQIQVNAYGLDHVIPARATAILIYDGTTLRWRLVSPSTPTRFYGTFALNLAAPGASPGCVDTAQTVAGAALGDRCVASMDALMQTGQQLSCHVSAANTVIFRVCDFDGAATDPDGTGANYNVDVWKN